VKRKQKLCPQVTLLLLLIFLIISVSSCYTIEPASSDVEVILEPLPPAPVIVNVTPLLITFPEPIEFPDGILFVSSTEIIPNEDYIWLSLKSAQFLTLYLTEITGYFEKMDKISNYQDEVFNTNNTGEGERID